MLVQSCPDRIFFFGDVITVDHKVLSESRNNHLFAVVVQDLATQWIQSYPCKTTTSQETQEEPTEVPGSTMKPKVIYTDNSWEFGKSCEELSWNHCTSTPHRSQTNGDCWESSAQNWGGDFCCAVAIRLGRKMGGRIPWKATATCETFKISCLMGRHPMKGGSEYHVMARLFRLDRW